MKILFKTFSVISLFSLFFISSTVSAAPPPNLKPLDKTSSLSLQCFDHKNNKLISSDSVHSWYDKIFDPKLSKDKLYLGKDDNRDILKSSLDKVLKDDKGVYGIYQYKNKRTDITDVGFVLFWTDSHSSANISAYGDFAYKFLLNDSNARYYRVRVDCYGNVYHALNGNLLYTERSENLFVTDNNLSSLFFYSGKTIIDEDIKDLVGIIPGSPGGEFDSSKKIISPEFDYEVRDKKVTITHRKDKDEIDISAFSNYTKDGWKLKNNSYQVKFTVQKRFSGDVIGTTQVVDAGGSFSMNLPENGEYSIVASYSALACYSYNSVTTPDYCIDAYADDTDLIDYQSKTMYLNINGDDFEGSTLTADCKSGFCEVKPKYEDCSVHDLNIKFWDGGPEFRFPSILSIGCTINNSLKWLVNEIILPLFMPSQDFLRDKFGELNNNLQDSFGFLWTPVTLIQTFYKGVVNNQISGDTCSLPPMTIFGSTAIIHLCSWRHQLPDLWRYMQLAIQGGLVVGLIWALYRLAMSFFGARVDDDEDDDSGFEEVRWHDDRTGEIGSWERRSKK